MEIFSRCKAGSGNYVKLADDKKMKVMLLSQLDEAGIEYTEAAKTFRMYIGRPAAEMMLSCEIYVGFNVKVVAATRNLSERVKTEFEAWSLLN